MLNETELKYIKEIFAENKKTNTFPRNYKELAQHLGMSRQALYRNIWGEKLRYSANKIKEWLYFCGKPVNTYLKVNKEKVSELKYYGFKSTTRGYQTKSMPLGDFANYCLFVGKKDLIVRMYVSKNMQNMEKVDGFLNTLGIFYDLIKNDIVTIHYVS